MSAVVVAGCIVLAAALGRQAVRAGGRAELAHRLAGSGERGQAVRDDGRGPDGAGHRAIVARARTWWSARPSRRRRAVVAGLPDLLEDAARLLRSGSSLRQALQDAPGCSPVTGPAGASLARAMARAERGEPLGLALACWADDEPLAEVRLTVAALDLAATGGGPVAKAVDGIAATLRERQAAMADIGMQSAQARLSAAVIAALPVVFTLWCIATDDRAAGFLFASPAGWLCLALGGGLLAVGAWWMARIVGSAT